MDSLRYCKNENVEEEASESDAIGQLARLLILTMTSHFRSIQQESEEQERKNSIGCAPRQSALGDDLASKIKRKEQKKVIISPIDFHSHFLLEELRKGFIASAISENSTF